MAEYRYRQPGEEGYVAPQPDWAKTQTIDQLIEGGYALTPEQQASLTPVQEDAQYTRYQGTEGYDPLYPGQFQHMGGDPNRVMTDRGLVKYLPAITAAIVGAAVGPGLSQAFMGGGSGASTAATVPGLEAGVGSLEGSLFPTTTAGASGLEAGILPLTTPGATGGFGSFLAPGASAGALGNVATGSTVPNVSIGNVISQGKDVYDKGKDLYDLYNDLTGSNRGQPAEQAAAPYVPYDMSAPQYIGGGIDSIGGGDYISQDIGTVQMAGGGYVGGIGGLPNYRQGGYLDGPGDGMSDSIPATIEGSQPAALADGEYIISSDAVSHIGNGSSKAGAKRLDQMMDNIRKARTGNPEQGKQINPDNFLPA